MRRLFCLCLLLLLSAPLVRAQDVSLDKKLGAENAALIEQEMGFYHHDSLTHLINYVGQKLVSRLQTNPFEYRFFLVDSAEPNAFALPGGYVYVTRGILAILQTEDELAGVMAHEIIHVAQRHSVKQLRKGILPKILTIPGNVINKVTGTGIGNVLNIPIGITTGAAVARYSRSHEAESDAFGIQLAASAGYQPGALANALERLLQTIELLTGEAEKRNYFSDHPFTPSRISSIRKSAPQYKPVDPAPLTHSREAFLQKFSGLCFGQNPAQGVFKDSLFVQPDLGFAWLLPSGWHTNNKPVAVSAFDEKGEAAVVLQIINSSKNVQEIGEEVKSKAEKSNQIMVMGAGDTIVNNLTSYYLRLKNTGNKSNTLMELLWIAYKGKVFQLVGIGNLTQAGIIKKSLFSFHAALASERLMAKLFAVEIAKANRNEKLEQLSSRTGNRLNLNLISVLNDVKTDSVLPEGTAIKIVKELPYISAK